MISHRFRTLWFEVTIRARTTLIYLERGAVAIVCDAMASPHESQSLLVGADVFVLGRIVIPVLGSEVLLAPTVFLLLVEQVVFDISVRSVLLQVGIILFVPIACIRDHGSREMTDPISQLFQMRDQTIDIICFLVDTEPYHELVLCPDLHVVTGLQLPVQHMVFFHAHEGRIVIGLGIAVAPGQQLFLLFILLLAQQVVFLQLPDKIPFDKFTIVA